MSARFIPPQDMRPDWSRLVAATVNRHSNEIANVTPTAVKVTAAYTVPINVDLILADATAGAFSVALPAAATSVNRRLTVKKIDASANAVTVDPNASETIDGALTKALAAQYDYVMIQSDGSNWWIV